MDGKCRSSRCHDSSSHDGGEPIGSQASGDLRYRPVVVRAYSCHELKTLPPRVGISGRSRILVLQVDDLKQGSCCAAFTTISTGADVFLECCNGTHFGGHNAIRLQTSSTR